jgi:predicted Rossmann fold nucleotide-binding protein DprA/Smf involved in DNA uptake
MIFTHGNEELMKLPKKAFLCSRSIPASAVLKCYDWAIEQREKGVCVISGFHSKIEKDVLHYLLQGSQPLIIALARGLKNRIDTKLKKMITEKRLLIISPFEQTIKRVTQTTSAKRNRLMVETADEIVFGHVSSKGNLESLRSEYKDKKPMMTL